MVVRELCLTTYQTICSYWKIVQTCQSVFIAVLTDRIFLIMRKQKVNTLVS